MNLVLVPISLIWKDFYSLGIDFTINWILLRYTHWFYIFIQIHCLVSYWTINTMRKRLMQSIINKVYKKLHTSPFDQIQREDAQMLSAVLRFHKTHENNRVLCCSGWDSPCYCRWKMKATSPAGKPYVLESGN